MRPSLSRSILGVFLIGAAVATRCLATAHGGVLMTFGSRLPALTLIDFFTAPVAFVGIAVLAGSRGLAPVRRLFGVIALIAAIAWPAIKFGDLSPVILAISSRHGVHVHDVVAFPILAVSMALLAPWRSALGPLVPLRATGSATALRPAVRH